MAVCGIKGKKCGKKLDKSNRDVAKVIILFDDIKKFLRPMKRRVVNYICKKRGEYALAHWVNYQNEKDRIRVGFIMQSTTCWNKIKPVFEKMRICSDIEAIGLIVPGLEGYDLKVNEAKRMIYGDEYDFFHELYNHNVIDVVQCGKIINIKRLNLDYVIYQRPYDILLPKQLRAKNVIKFAKTIYIPYGCTGAKVYEDLQLSCKDFFSYIYFYFTGSEHLKNVFIKSPYYGEWAAKKYSHYIFCGYPGFCSCVDGVYEKQKRINVLWTPRWTYDEKVGGSHFFEYFQNLIDFQLEHKEIQLIIRPHPLMLDNFIKEGKITQEWKDKFFCMLEEAGVIYDDNDDVNDTFKKTDVLITDFSSIIANYCFTGRPMIYCPDRCNELNDVYKSIVKGAYRSENWQELKKALELIISGKDDLIEVRKSIKQEWEDNHIHAADNIVEIIKKDSGLKS